VRHRSDDVIDEKSKPSDEMPDWWISSSWVPLESDDDDEFIDITNRDSNNDRNNDKDDNNNNNNDNNDNNNNNDNNDNNDNNNNNNNNNDASSTNTVLTDSL